MYNASGVVRAVLSLHQRLPVSQDHIVQSLTQVSLLGRFQTIAQHPEVIVDVAHNTQSAHALCAMLENMPVQPTFAVFSMLADKDIPAVIDAMKQHIAAWYVAEINHPRKADLVQLVAAIRQQVPAPRLQIFLDLQTAYQQAISEARASQSRVLVFWFFLHSGSRLCST